MGGARAVLRLAAVALLCSVAALAAAPWQDRKTDPGNNPVTGKACAFDGSCPFSRYVGAGGRRAWGSHTRHVTRRSPHFFCSCEVCGQYCGPGWCGGECRSERNCSYDVQVRVCALLCSFPPLLTPPQPTASCSDKCCQAHDQCCGCVGIDDPYVCDPVSGWGQQSCNSAFTACLNACSARDQCIDSEGVGHGPIPISLAFAALSHQCCGKACPPSPTCKPPLPPPQPETPPPASPPPVEPGTMPSYDCACLKQPCNPHACSMSCDETKAACGNSGWKADNHSPEAELCSNFGCGIVLLESCYASCTTCYDHCEVCNECQCERCEVGQFRSGCAGSSEGSCLPCTGLPEKATWITDGGVEDACSWALLLR